LHRRLQLEGRALRAQAHQLREHGIENSGQVIGGSADELVAALSSQPEVIAPPLFAVRTWFAESLKAAVAKQPALAQAPRRAMLVWRDGVIVEGYGESRVELIPPPSRRNLYQEGLLQPPPRRYRGPNPSVQGDQVAEPADATAVVE
jgi:hypothetical protein